MTIISTPYRQKIKEAMVLAMPIVASQLGLVLMGFFDTIQVGGLGPTTMGACGVGNSVYFLFNLLGMGVLYSVSPLVSEAFGEKHGWKSIGVLKSATMVAAAVSLLFFCIMEVVIRHFDLFRESATITHLAQTFLSTLNYSTPMLIFLVLGTQFMNGMGRTRVPMTVTLIGLVVNVFLNWVLIYGKLGLPAYGITGAAIATGTARTLMCVILGIYILNDKQVKLLMREFVAKQALHKGYIPQILKIGIPSGLQMFFEVGAFSAAQIMTGWLGESSLAAYQVAISLASITFMMVSGLATSGTIMTGYAYGAGDRDGIRMAGNTVYLLGFCSQFFFAIVFLVFNNYLPVIYTRDQAVIAMASKLIVLAGLFQLSDGFQIIGVGILRGIQDVTVPSVMAFTSYWIVMVPLCYTLAFYTSMHEQGIWLGFVIGLSVAAVLMYLRFRYKLKHLVFVEL